MTFIQRLRIAYSIMVGRFHVSHVCGARKEITARSRGHEIKMTFKDLRKPDRYSREELVEMLHHVRKHQALQGWTDAERDAAET